MSDFGRVLLADRNDLTLADILRSKGYHCDRVSDVAEAAQMLAAIPYDALILDIDIPNNDDLCFVHKVQETRNGLSVILVTDHPTMESAIHAVHLPVMAYLVKPIDWNQLRSHIDRSVKRSRLYRAVTDVRSRFVLWDKEVGRLQELLQMPLEEHTATFVGPLLATTFENIIKSASDLRRFIDLLSVGDPASRKQEVVGLLNKMELTRVALHETVHVLEETKHAFKSKRLGELRRQIKALLGVLEQD